MSAYKLIQDEGTALGMAEGAFAAVEELATEMREWFDNMEGGNLGQTDKCQRVGEAADTLEQVQALDFPECVQDLPAVATISVNRRKSDNPSRAVRCANAGAQLGAAHVALCAWLEEEANSEHDDRDEVQTLCDELDDIVSQLEGVEFPGMYG